MRAKEETNAVKLRHNCENAHFKMEKIRLKRVSTLTGMRKLFFPPSVAVKPNSYTETESCQIFNAYKCCERVMQKHTYKCDIPIYKCNACDDAQIMAAMMIIAATIINISNALCTANQLCAIH